MTFKPIISLFDTDAPTYPPTKDVWGNARWTDLHTLAATYSENPSRSERKEYKQMIEGLLKYLPCDTCKANSKKHRKSIKINYKNRYTLSKSLCELHNVVNADLGKPAVDCSIILGKSMPKTEKEECQSCKLTLRDTNYYSDYEKSLINIVNKRCDEAGVARPPIEFGTCPIHNHNEKSCTQFDLSTKKGRMIFNPKTASAKSAEHEVEHWIRLQKGDIEGAKDERSVDITARARLNEEFDKDLYTKLGHNRSLVTLADTDSFDSDSDDSNENSSSGSSGGESGIFSGIDSFYKPLSDLTKVPASALNDANTPEILGYTLDALQDMTLTPFGSVLTNVVTGLGLIGVSIMMPELGKRDKIFINELGAHKFWSIIRYANPNTNRVAHQQATAVGQALGSGNFASIMSNIIQTPTPPPQPAAAAKAMPPNMSMNVGVAQARGVNTPAANLVKKSFYINHG